METSPGLYCRIRTDVAWALRCRNVVIEQTTKKSVMQSIICSESGCNLLIIPMYIQIYQYVYLKSNQHCTNSLYLGIRGPFGRFVIIMVLLYTIIQVSFIFLSYEPAKVTLLCLMVRVTILSVNADHATMQHDYPY